VTNYNLIWQPSFWINCVKHNDIFYGKVEDVKLE